MTERGRQRVVVTGIGAVTPIGTGRTGLWNGVKRGRSAVGPVTRFDAAPFARAWQPKSATSIH